MSKYYAVKVGKNPGIYTSWPEAEAQVKGYPKAKHKSFKTRAEADNFMLGTVTNQPSHTRPTQTRTPQPRQTRTPPRRTTNQPPYNDLTVYTDGSCIDKVGGYGYIILYQNNEYPIKGKVPYYPTTNQVAELTAIYCTLATIKQSFPHLPVTIYTDSKYSIGCLTQWCSNWKRNGWVNSKGEPVKNQEIIKAILEVSRGMKITYHHVKAHNGDKYNEIADRLANEGRLMQ